MSFILERCCNRGASPRFLCHLTALIKLLVAVKRLQATVSMPLNDRTGTYFLQEVRAKYTCVSPLCELCDEDVENLDHFLLKCKVLHAPR
jgi:hypothetical protein